MEGMKMEMWRIRMVLSNRRLEKDILYEALSKTHGNIV